MTIETSRVADGVWEIPQLEYISANVTDDGASCNNDGILGNGESGHLTITLHNQGSNTLTNPIATVTSSNPLLNCALAWSALAPWGSEISR